jgi:uncharacterized protein involved in high-affinity Fe2+ transport
MKTKQVYMLTNGYAVLPDGFESFLYAGLGYTLKEEDAESMIKEGLAIPMEDPDGAPKAKNLTDDKPGKRKRGKGLSPRRRKP